MAAVADATRPDANQPPPHHQRYGPRTCRICLETVYPTFETSTTIPGLSSVTGTAPKLRPVYTSEDPDSGRLISPCKCKGSQKYVHEACLQSWRKSNPTADRNFWRCPTCGYEYRLERLTWGRWLRSPYIRVGMTLGILGFSIFALGFVADPILSLWADPLGTVGETIAGVWDDVEAIKAVPLPDLHSSDSWTDHFWKGLYSLGLLGAVKSIFAMSPWQYFNLRSGGIFGARRQRAGDGRDRLESVSLVLVMLGIVTVVGAVWTGISKVSARVLEKASERVVDVGGDDDDDDDSAAEQRKNQ